MAELTGRRRFAHLYRRAGFGASEAELNAAMALDGNEDAAFAKAVDRLLQYQAVPEVPDRIVLPPDLDDFSFSTNTLIRWWLERMLHTRRPLLEKMVLFWHDHFATSYEKDEVKRSRIKRQNEFFRANALGNFEQILNGISRDPAMMGWLDLIYNDKKSPNENYARELLELFALGPSSFGSPNYTEEDIREVTRAFTGYSLNAADRFYINQRRHDPTPKRAFGQTFQTGDQVNAIVVRLKKPNGRNICAHFLAAKLFSFFVYPAKPEDSAVAPFATRFVASNFSVRALVRVLLLSPEFSSYKSYRSTIKSPVELAVGTLRALGAERVPKYGVITELEQQGQRLFDPPNVGGWPGGRSWINSGTILSRCNTTANIVNWLGKTGENDAGGQKVATLLDDLTTPEERVDRVLTLLVDGPDGVPPAARDALIAYAGEIKPTDWKSAKEEKIRGLFNLVAAQPAYQIH